MRFHDFDLNLLVYLDALLTEKSVSKAAAHVNITQPAMSEALARLREYFRDDLLVQVAGRSMILTPLASCLAGPVRETLLQVQSLVSTTTMFVPERSDRKFSVMASDYVFDVLLKAVLARLCDEAPRVRLQFQRLSTDSREHIRQTDLDLLIVPQQYLAEELPSEILFEDTVTCVVWSGNRLVGECVSLEQYIELGHVCQGMDGHMAAYDQWFLGRFGNRLKPEIVVPGFAMVLEAIEGTQRIATVHSRHADMYLKQFSLRQVRPPVDFPRSTECMQWHRHQERDPGLVWLRGVIKAEAAVQHSSAAAMSLVS